MSGRAKSVVVIRAAETLIDRAEAEMAAGGRPIPASGEPPVPDGPGELGVSHPALAERLRMAGINHAQVATAVGCSRVLVSRVLTGKTAERRGWSAMVVQVAERLLAEATGQAIPVSTSAPLRTVPAIREALLRERAELDELRRAMVVERDQAMFGKRELAEQQRRLDAERRKLELSRIVAGLPRRLEIARITRTQLANAAQRNISQVSRVLAGYGTSPHIVQVAERLLTRAARRRRQGKRRHNK